MCTHEKTIYSNEVKFIEELYKWYDKEKMLLTTLKFKKILDQLNSLITHITCNIYIIYLCIY